MAGGIQSESEIDFSHFSFNSVNVEDLHNNLDWVLSFHEKPVNLDSLDEILNSIYYIISKIPLPMLDLPLKYIVRGRANFNGKIFNQQWQLSYNSRNRDKIPLCRFNLPEETMFYGAVPSGSQGVLLGTAALECYKEIVSATNTELIQYCTFGKWHLNNNIVVFNFCYSEEALNKNPQLESFCEQYLKPIKKKVPSLLFEFILRFWRVFSDLAGKKSVTPQQYLITTGLFWAIREYIRRDFGEATNGIIYPSSMTESEGYNIVLTPEAVDKYLNLKEVFMMKFVREINRMESYKIHLCSNIAEVVNGEFNLHLIDSV
jgi:hypothetical protein